MTAELLMAIILFIVYCLELEIEKRTGKMVPLFGLTLVVLVLPLFVGIGLAGQVLYMGFVLAVLGWWGAACWVANWWDGDRHPR